MIAEKENEAVERLEENMENSNVDEIRVIVQHREEQVKETLKMMAEIEAGARSLQSSEDRKDSVHVLAQQQVELEQKVKKLDAAKQMMKSKVEDGAGEIQEVIPVPVADLEVAQMEGVNGQDSKSYTDETPPLLPPEDR